MSGSAARVTALTRDLANKWENTKNSWRDAKAEEFERQYLEELLNSVDKAATVMEQLDKLIGKIRHDCE
jgi:hypothetical protein